jgi:5-hydroxyisourate hydrolase
MPGVSIHVVDVSRGVVAAGMRVELHRVELHHADPQRLIAASVISANGLFDAPALAATFTPGEYEAVFHVAEYFRGVGVTLPPVPFMTVVTYRFGIAEPQQHYHLPMKLTPWGLSCFRGGA